MNNQLPKMPLIAYAWATGRIEFGTKLPDGALPIATSGKEKVLIDTVTVLARHGYEKGVLLVPGIPEAPNGDEARKALTRFCYLVERDLLAAVQELHQNRYSENKKTH